jgi:hypothetical protein
MKEGLSAFMAAALATVVGLAQLRRAVSVEAAPGAAQPLLVGAAAPDQWKIRQLKPVCLPAVARIRWSA